MKSNKIEITSRQERENTVRFFFFICPPRQWMVPELCGHVTADRAIVPADGNSAA